MRATVLLSLLGLAVVTRALHAQCEAHWIATNTMPGVSDQAHTAVLWDPDGLGGEASRLVVGGDFFIAGAEHAPHVAQWDGNRWTALGFNLPNMPVYQLLSTSGGELFASCDVGVFRWSGSMWEQVGGEFGPFPGRAYALALLPNDAVIATGSFTHVGAEQVNGICVWNGNSWSGLGTGFTLDGGRAFMKASVVLDNGDIVVGGSFDHAGGNQVTCVARWDGSQWHAYGSDLTGRVTALAAVPGSSDIVVGGAISIAGGVTQQAVARWNGASWTVLGEPFSPSANFGEVLHLQYLSDGTLVASGEFSNTTGSSLRGIATWDGTHWNQFEVPVGGGDPLSIVSGLVQQANGGLVAVGNFRTGPANAYNVAQWDGTQWMPLGMGMANPARVILSTSSGDVIIAAPYTTHDGLLTNGISRWNPTSQAWSSLGSGTSSLITGLAELPNGDIVAGGFMTFIGGVSANRIARWNGSTWGPIGTGMNLSVNCVEATPDGSLIAGGAFTIAGGTSASKIARWDVSGWSSLGSGVNADVYSVAVLPSGEIIAGGDFTTAGGVSAQRVARWNGTAWSSLGAGFGGRVRALLVLPSGAVIAGGAFSNSGAATVNHVARWDGSSWVALGNGLPNSVSALENLQDGRIVATGFLPSVGGVAVWDGVTWSSLGGGVTSLRESNTVYCVEAIGEFELLISGDFHVAGEVPTPFLARWGVLTPCCDSIDFNVDSLVPDTLDIADFIAVFGGGVCTGQSPGETPCNTDVDFNNDGQFPEIGDIENFLAVFGGGACE